VASRLQAINDGGNKGRSNSIKTID